MQKSLPSPEAVGSQGEPIFSQEFLDKARVALKDMATIVERLWSPQSDDGKDISLALCVVYSLFMHALKLDLDNAGISQHVLNHMKERLEDEENAQRFWSVGVGAQNLEFGVF